MKKFFVLLIIAITLTLSLPVEAATISVSSEEVIQGEPLKINVDGISDVAGVKQITFDGNVLGVFMFNQKVTALYGVDLNKKPGVYKVLVTLADGSVLEKKINIIQRKKVEAVLGIPEKLGGNTPQAATNLVSSLSNENTILSSLGTHQRTLWTETFLFPTENPFVTDSYGYSRQTVGNSIAHKGTDFRAPEGTVIRAANRGVVRLVKKFNTYGNTVVIDHGMGLMSFYMHLSKVSVNQGQLALRGQEIGKSGQTGYADSPHLHLSVRLNNTSIDPMKFMDFFK